MVSMLAQSYAETYEGLCKRSAESAPRLPPAIREAPLIGEFIVGFWKGCTEAPLAYFAPLIFLVRCIRRA